ncbi:MAG: DUF1415 domain-containing protein [Methylococcales bacterium]|nr:DUF1415 domain-containing protein [Methylococcales bacterium]
MNPSTILTVTRNWLTSFIIAHDICPFAGHVHEKDSIRYRVADSGNLETCLQMLITECRHLDAEPGCETTLLILPKVCPDFDDFLDLLAIAEQLLIEQGYEGIYQLASFHPDYCFADSAEDDPANYTNRSPHPMLHIIREASIERALRNYADPQAIPERNIELMRKIGRQELQARLEAIRNNSQNLPTFSV